MVRHQSLRGSFLILSVVSIVAGSELSATASSDDILPTAAAPKVMETSDLTARVEQAPARTPKCRYFSDDDSSVSKAESNDDASDSPAQNPVTAESPNFTLELTEEITVSVTGQTIFSHDEIEEAVKNASEVRQVIQSFEEGELTWEIREDRERLLTAVADAITNLYLSRDYLTSRARVIESHSNVEINEGSLSEIQIRGTQRLTSYICDRIQLGAGTPLNLNKLEDQLRLLRVDPLIENIEANLKQAETIGQSILEVRVTLANFFGGSVTRISHHDSPKAYKAWIDGKTRRSTLCRNSWFAKNAQNLVYVKVSGSAIAKLVRNPGVSTDNYSPPSVGSERFGVNLYYRNLANLGGEASFYRSISATGGAEEIEFAYGVPLNAMNGRLRLRVAANQNEVTQSEFDDLDIQGETYLYEVNFRQPLVRSPREEFALSLGFTFQNGQTFIFDRLPTPFGSGPDGDGVSRTSVFEFSQEYLRRDLQGAWSLRSQFSIGTGLFDATTNEGSVPDGQFLRWLGQVQRVQRLSEDHLLIVQADLQLTPGSLLPAQQFVIGGGQSVRGYRQNARSGDNGFRFSVENQITLERDEAGVPTLLLAPFFNMGLVWNDPDNPNSLPAERFLAGLGMGLIIEPESPLSFRFDYAAPLNLLDDRGNNLQDVSYYFSVRYDF